MYEQMRSDSEVIDEDTGLNKEEDTKKEIWMSLPLPYYILEALRHNQEGLHFNAIFRNLGGSPNTLSESLKYLLSKGLISVREEPGRNLPKRIYSITERGLEAILEFYKEYTDIEKTKLNKINEEMEKLANMLQNRDK